MGRLRRLVGDADLECCVKIFRKGAEKRLPMDFKPGKSRKFMKAYLDANIYICYLLGEAGEEEIDTLFNSCVSCKFGIVASKTVFGEVQARCKNSSVILLQNTIDRLRKNGKLEVVDTLELDFERAESLNHESGGKFGINDFYHAILAAKHAEVFVTNDGEFSSEASKIVKTASLWKFIQSLKL